VSTRADILAALSDHPDGLTLHEIAPLCKACECDEQIVGRTVGMLKSEGVIYPAGMRESVLVYAMGKPPEEELVNEPRIGEPLKPSEAVRAVSEMRRRNGVPHPTVGRESMKPPLLDRCIEAMKRHGPCTQAQLAKHTGSTPGSISTIICMLKARGVVKHRNGREPAVYSLPGTIVKRADIPIFNEQKPDALKRGAELGKITPPKGHGPAAQSRSRNGGAAGPALFGQALKALQDERAAALAQLEKLDRAIEAIEALA
jgi:hypothetical protein